MTKWATIDRDKLFQLRNEKWAELSALVDTETGRVRRQKWADVLESASLHGCVMALDAVLEATKPRSDG